jgi:iron complex outermembrane recepter protein
MLLAALPVALVAALFQAPTRPDSAIRRDTVRLQTLDVKVTRSDESRLRVPAAVGVLDTADLRSGRLLAGPEESLGRIPGLFVADRSNPSLDDRLVIRGAGSRATFGVRGLKILIDGIPQTLPDGQSQLSNLDLGTVQRVEVLRGSSSALYGNASGGVIAFTTGLPTERAMANLRVGGGTFGTTRASLTAGGSQGRVRGQVTATQFRSDGFRRHSRSLSRQLSLAGDVVISPTWLARARYFLAANPRAENPGALTATEYATSPDASAPNNLLRGADKRVTQHQLGLTLSHADARGGRVEATVFGVLRNLDNPLASTPPGGGGPTVGTFSSIDRVVGGARLFAERPLKGWGARLGAGLDLQRMRDDRLNTRSDSGARTDQVFADQRETVTEVGPFVTLHLTPTEPLTVTAAVRYDRLTFAVEDHYLGDGIDQTGSRTMDALSGAVGVSLTREAWSVYANLSSAFETPTTTEFANQGAGVIGFNPNLGPQRASTAELGFRRVGPVGVDLALYTTSIQNAIVQAEEQDGRAYFENAGQLRHRGIELGLDAQATRWLRARVAYTYSASTFRRYRIRNGAGTDTLDGNRVPGVPRHLAQVTLQATRGPVRIELEQRLVSDQAANDLNTITVPGWGAGVTTARVATRFPLGGRAGRVTVSPFAAVINLFDHRYVGSVNVNGFGGRVFEPAPGRTLTVGASLDWRGSE